MESVTNFWNNHSLAGRWALGWLAAHIATLALVALLAPFATLTLMLVANSAIGVVAAYLLARRGREKMAAIGLCAILSIDFHGSMLGNYVASDDRYNILIVVSLFVVAMAGHLLGKRGIIVVAGLSFLTLFVGQARYAPDQYMAAIAYGGLAIAIYLVVELRESQRAEIARGVIIRYTEHSGYVGLHLETPRGEVLRQRHLRVAKPYWRSLALARGDHIVIARGEVRVEGDQVYIQAFSIRKLKS